ncbi:MAG: hypothetical protein QW222_05455 [Candidatus Bathyarchaeia archaeon]
MKTFRGRRGNAVVGKRERSDGFVDEKVLSNLEGIFRLKTWNTWTVLLESISMGHIEVSDIELAIEELREKRHKLKSEQANQILNVAKLATQKRRGKRTVLVRLMFRFKWLCMK